MPLPNTGCPPRTRITLLPQILPIIHIHILTITSPSTHHQHKYFKHHATQEDEQDRSCEEDIGA
jgi:hypothetical protein